MRSTAWRSSGRCVERPGLRILWCLWTTLEKAKALPGVFNNYAVFYGGAFQTVNLLDAASLRRLLKR